MHKLIKVVLFVVAMQLITVKSTAAEACNNNSSKSAPACLGLQEKKEMSYENKSEQKNVLGTKLQPCGFDPKTGFFRNGSCETGPNDRGVHTVCAVLTNEFLSFTKSQGNDLTTPLPQFDFPGLKAGQRWCLCATRWAEAEKAGYAPKVVLEATNEKTLKIVPLETLKKYDFEKK